MPSHNSVKQNKKPSCPFGRHCFSDSSVCGWIGYFVECPQRIDDRIYAEIKEDGYEGVDPYTIFRALKKAVRE